MGSHFLLQQIFLTQGLNLHLLHWQADSLSLAPAGRPGNLILWAEQSKESLQRSGKDERGSGNRGLGLCQVTWTCGVPTGFPAVHPPEGWRVLCPACNGPPGPGFPCPSGARPTPRDTMSPLTCLPDGAAVRAPSEAKPVTEGRRPVGLAVAVLPVVAHLLGSRGQRHKEGGRVRTCLHLGQHQVPEP